MEFKTKKEWFAEAKRLRAEGLSASEISEKLGTFKVDGKTYTIHNKGADGITSVDMEGRKARGNRRNAAIKEQDVKLLETLKKGGMSDTEAKAVLKKEKAGYKRIEHQAAELNKEHGKGAFNAGHETAALEGGGNYGRNARVEIGKSRIRADGTRMRGNQSRGRIDEAPDSIKPVMGIPRSGRGGEDTALFNLLEKDVPGIMDLGLTPQDKQNIKRNPAGADDIIAARQARLRPGLQVSGGNIRMRGMRALPFVGPVIATGIAGQQALAGDFVGAGGTLLDEAVGEVGLDSQPTASGELRDAPANHQAIVDRMNNPTVADKVIADPLNELEYAGKQVMNFFGDALRMGSEAGY